MAIEQMISARLPNGAMGVRVAPKMAPQAYRSFEVHSPLATHYRNVSCREMECQHYLGGWVSPIDVSTEQGRKWAVAIRRSGRRYTYEQAGSVVTFRFPPGQICFQAPHRVAVGRPELFVVRDGDWRGNPTGRRDLNVKPAEFVERMAENLDVLTTAIGQG
jgi:hypothetical protein